MSAPPSDLPLPERVHRELTGLLGEGGPLAVPPAALVEFLTDDVLHADVAAGYRNPGDGTGDERAVVITAGVPGAGKSSAVAGVTHHRHIDSDAIKDLLLARADDAGLLDVRHEHRLCDGAVVRPGELANWVHRASTDLADLVRLECLRRGENLVVEGTLAWAGLGRQYLDELASFDYERVTVVDVEVARPVAIAQARGRWWAGRTGTVGVGGRFLLDATYDEFYPSGPEVSVCSVRARALYEAAADAGFDARLASVVRDPDGTVTSTLRTPGGVVPWAASAST